MMIYQAALQLIDRFIADEHNGNVSSAARALGISVHALYRWHKRERKPNGEDLGIILDKMGARLIPPGKEQTREICFINDVTVNMDKWARLPQAKDYLAVPLVSEAGAGPGIIPIDEYESWFLVYRNEPSIRMRSNLIAVRIAKGSTSMEPTLHPNDIVLVDRDDKIIARPGGIWLVMEPDGSGKVKRVKIDDVKARRATRVTFYSDNVAENPPEIYSLEEDYGGDWSRVIVGRVVWAWSDLSKK